MIMINYLCPLRLQINLIFISPLLVVELITAFPNLLTIHNYHILINLSYNLPSMRFLPSSPLEIVKVPYSLNTSHSCGIDNVGPCIAHEFMSLIADPLSSNFNCSFRTGIVPSELKSLKVIPLFKSGDYNNFIHYRPTSILPCFSKLIEKIARSRLCDYFDKFHLLNDSLNYFPL